MEGNGKTIVGNRDFRKSGGAGSDCVTEIESSGMGEDGESGGQILGRKIGRGGGRNAVREAVRVRCDLRMAKWRWAGVDGRKQLWGEWGREGPWRGWSEGMAVLRSGGGGDDGGLRRKQWRRRRQEGSTWVTSDQGKGRWRSRRQSRRRHVVVRRRWRRRRLVSFLDLP